MFHDIKGKNIKLDGTKTTASWVPSHTGGHVFTGQPLIPDKQLTLKLEGTGGIELGVICEDPEQMSNDFSAYRNDQGIYQFLNDVKIHKRTCEMNVKIDYRNQEVTSTYGRGIYTQKLNGDHPYWLTADVKYGEVEVKLITNGGRETYYKFSATKYGKNMQILNDPTIARSRTKSPASLCIYGSPVNPGMTLDLQCTPKPHQGTTPGRFYVKMFITNLNPQQLQTKHPDRFDISTYPTDTPSWTCIETFEKDDCHGKTMLEFGTDMLKYKSANNKTGIQHYNVVCNDGFWLVLELYGVSVKIKKADTNQSPNVPGVDEIDAAPLQPRPLHQHQNSSFVSVESNVEPTLIPIPESNENDPQDFVVRPASRTRNTDKINLDLGIRRHFTFILDSFSYDRVADILYEREVITLVENEHIHSLEGREAARKTLSFMSKRPISRQLLEHCLKETAQCHLLSMFLNEKEKE